MIPNRLEQIVLQDIQRLHDMERSEDRTIEYKSELPSQIESEKIKRLLKPVCSFANTDGGDLIFGIQDEQGIPKELTGVRIADVNEQKLSIEQTIQSGIEPQLRGVQTRELAMSNGQFILIVRVPKSWASLHRVKSNRQFYARNSAGCFELDVPQIRHAFIASETIAQRIRDFRAERIARLLGKEAPVLLVDGVRIVLHLVPLSSFATQSVVAVKEYSNLYDRLVPRGTLVSSHYLNFEGMVTAYGNGQTGHAGYAQFFRSGIIEFVRVYWPGENNRLNLPSQSYEKELLHSYQSGIRVLQDLGISPPAYVFLTLVGAKGYRLGISIQQEFAIGPARPFDRDVVLIPDAEVDSFDSDSVVVMKPLFDIIWNTAGFLESINFDENNKWVNHR